MSTNSNTFLLPTTPNAPFYDTTTTTFEIHQLRSTLSLIAALPETSIHTPSEVSDWSHMEDWCASEPHTLSGCHVQVSSYSDVTIFCPVRFLYCLYVELRMVVKISVRTHCDVSDTLRKTQLFFRLAPQQILTMSCCTLRGPPVLPVSCTRISRMLLRHPIQGSALCH